MAMIMDFINWWKDAVLLESKWTGLYFKNLADNDQCDEFEYIKEIKVLK